MFQHLDIHLHLRKKINKAGQETVKLNLYYYQIYCILSLLYKDLEQFLYNSKYSQLEFGHIYELTYIVFTKVTYRCLLH